LRILLKKKAMTGFVTEIRSDGYRPLLKINMPISTELTTRRGIHETPTLEMLHMSLSWKDKIT
jgi:hypothetical protein